MPFPENEVFFEKSESLVKSVFSELLCGTQKQSPLNCNLHQISGVIEQFITSSNKF